MSHLMTTIQLTRLYVSRDVPFYILCIDYHISTHMDTRYT